MPSIKEIKDYYDFSKLDYQIYNLAFSGISMHFGLWDEKTKTHKQALLNENKVLSEIAGINSGDYVLDIGCGYGTTSVWIAKNINCKVLGITISQKQVNEANILAKKHGVENLTNFKVMDFHTIEFPENTFDVVLAIESISHSKEKIKVLKEIYKVLKIDGIFVIADGFFAKNKRDLSRREKEIARICFEGVHVPPVAEQKEFQIWLEEAGFKSIQWFDKTLNILKTSKRVSILGKLFLPFSTVLGLCGFKQISTSHVKAFIYQYYAWKDGIGVYGIFSAKK